MASDIKTKTKDKRKDRNIVRESTMPWNQAGYKAQLQKDLEDIWQKISRVLGKDLDKSDNSFVEAVGPVKRIEGSVLVDLCLQRSGKRGSGCDVPESADGFSKPSKGFPTPVTSPLRPPKTPAAQMRQYSRHIYDREEVYFCIRMLKPLKTEKEEEKLKDKHQKDEEFTAPHPNHEKNMMSLLHSGRKAERESQQVSTIGEYNNSGIKPIDRISRKTDDIYTLKLSKARKDKKERKFKCPGSTNYDVMTSDVIVTGANGDVTMRDVLAGKRSHAYIFPSADFWASCLYYFNTYIVNLESDHNFTIFCELIYLYIYI